MVKRGKMYDAEEINMEFESFTVAVIQHPPVFLNIEESIKEACAFIEEAKDGGADLIAFPETWLPGYPVWLDFSPKAALWDYPPARALYRLLVENSVTIPGKHLKKLLEIARKTSTCIIMGAHEHGGGTLYNTMIFIDKTGRFNIHRKLMPTYTERMIWGQGDGSTLTVVPTEYGNVGGLICWEHWMPLARVALHAQYETVHVAQWPMVKDLHHIASRHYAFEGRCFVLAAGCIIKKGEVIEGFNSHKTPDKKAAVAPDTEYIKEPVYNPCILYASMDSDCITEGRLFLDTVGHYSRPDVFNLTVNTAPQHNVTFASDQPEKF